MNADHVNMTKFSGPDDQTYKNVRDELKRMIEVAKKRAAEALELQDQDDNRARHVGNNTHGAMANYGNPNISSQGNSGGSLHYGMGCTSLI